MERISFFDSRIILSIIIPMCRCKLKNLFFVILYLFKNNLVPNSKTFVSTILGAKGLAIYKQEFIGLVF
jgi:hypothetical protein